MLIYFLSTVNTYEGLVALLFVRTTRLSMINAALGILILFQTDSIVVPIVHLLRSKSSKNEHREKMSMGPTRNVVLDYYLWWFWWTTWLRYCRFASRIRAGFSASCCWRCWIRWDCPCACCRLYWSRCTCCRCISSFTSCWAYRRT